MTCKFRQGAKSMVECGLANTGLVFGEVIQHGVGIAPLTLHFKLYGGLVGSGIEPIFSLNPESLKFSISVAKK
jgi:hypothetical protein